VNGIVRENMRNQSTTKDLWAKSNFMNNTVILIKRSELSLERENYTTINTGPRSRWYN